MRYLYELLIVDLRPGWTFLDLTDDSLFHEAELSSQFKCRVLFVLHAPCSCAHTCVFRFCKPSN
jgi:hypothetical protein